MVHVSKVLLTIALWSYGTYAALAAEPKKIEHSKRTTVMLAEPITMQLLQNAAIQIVEEKEPVTIYIDSHGGDYTAAKLFGKFLDMRRARGQATICFAGPSVMSAAYYIFLHCDKRFVLKTSILFPHKIHVWFSIPISGPQLLLEGAAIIEEQARWDGQARNITGMTEEDYLQFRDSDEAFWSIEYVQALSRNKWFEVVDGYVLNVK
jgi:ATP-dependent protease ClpP protease subunit